MLEQVLGYFEAGYQVFVGSCGYGEYQCDDEEEIRDAMPDEDDSFRSVSIDVDHEAHEVHFFVSDDE